MDLGANNRNDEAVWKRKIGPPRGKEEVANKNKRKSDFLLGIPIKYFKCKITKIPLKLIKIGKPKWTPKQ